MVKLENESFSKLHKAGISAHSQQSSQCQALPKENQSIKNTSSEVIQLKVIISSIQRCSGKKEVQFNFWRNSAQKLNCFKNFITILQANPLMVIQQEKKSDVDPPKKKYFTDSKKLFENMFKYSSILLALLSLFLFHNVYLFQTMPQFDSIRQGTAIQILLYGVPFTILFVIFDTAYHKVFDNLFIKYVIDERKYEGKAKVDRAYVLVKWSYSIIYYFLASLTSYFLIKDTNFFPTWLGGNGSCINIVLTAPRLPQATFGMKMVYMMQFGKHLGRSYIHVFIKRQGNYYQYILHHSLSVFLIIFSYLTNQWVIGLMVLMSLDMSDAFLSLMRGYKDYRNHSKIVQKIIYVFGVFVWLFMRFGVFISCCVYPAIVGPSYGKDKLTRIESQVLMLPYKWMGYMLAFLMVLNVFWTYYIFKAVIDRAISSKLAKNTYEE